MVDKNIWLAAGDGDLPRVKDLVELHSVSPNGPDENSYTPMHAAASYGHIHVLDYLISKGGDVNVADQDGDTPLYTVEDIDTARFLVLRGAAVGHRNNEDASPIEHLSEDFPSVAEFLQTHTNEALSTQTTATPVPQLSQHSQNTASEQLTSALMESVRQIMETEAIDPELALHQAVTRAVLEGVVAGYDMSTDEPREHDQHPTNHEMPSKRARRDSGP